MSKRALLIGCNYPGSQAALNGCINDVWGTKNMLTTYFGFQDKDIIVMIDTDPSYTQPTGANIKAKLSELVQASQDGDVLFVHYSGHGTQVPCERPGEEADNKDEAICPCDMNVITDDDLRAIFKPLGAKQNVKFTFIADCCHSGSLLDHEEVVITGPKPGGPQPPAIDIGAIQSMLASLGAGGNREFKNRALPTNDWMAMLSEKLGSPVVQGNVRSALTQVFGADASVKAQEYVKYIQMGQQLLNKFQGGNATEGGKQGGEGGVAGILSALLGVCLGGGAANAAVDQPAAGGGVMGTAPPGVAPGTKPPPGDRLSDDVGILVTGCQAAETSADACPSGDKAKAHGALSNAMHQVVKAHYEQNPGAPLTYRNLVVGVREALAKANFAQNPCLECSEKLADSPFVV